MKSYLNILLLLVLCIFSNFIQAEEIPVSDLQPIFLEGDTTIMEQTGYQILTDCAGVILDPGGYDNYPNNTLSIITIQPPSPANVTLFFSEFNIENNFDDFYIYDGPSQTSPLIGQYDNMELLGQTIVSSGGPLTIVFDADNSVTREGFIIDYSVAGGSETPVANFVVSQNTPIPLNSPVTFTDLSQNAGTWLYDFGDGMQSNEQNPVHSFSTPGTYEVSLTISNCSNSNTYTQTVIVQESGQLEINPEETCVTLNSFMTTTVQVVLSNTGVGDLYYNFSEISEENPNSLTVILGTGVIPPGGVQAVNLFFSAGDLLGGTYDLDLLLETGDANQLEFIYPVKMIVVGIPLMLATPNSLSFPEAYLNNPITDSICISNQGTDTLRITDVTIDAPGYSVSPTEINVAPGGETKLNITLLTEEVGVFSGEMSVIGNAGIVTIPLFGEVIDPPVGIFTPDDICLNLTQGESTLVIMGISNAGGEVLNWGFGFPNTIPSWLEISNLNDSVEPNENGNVPIIINATGLISGTYEYNATIFTNDPILGQAYVNFKLNVAAPPIANFFPNNQNSCDGFVSFTDTSFGDVTSWLWDFGDNNSSVEQNPEHTYAETGVYDVSLIACNPVGCDTILYNELITYSENQAECTVFTMGTVGDTTFYNCNGYIYDSGGQDQDYLEDTNYSVTISPPDALSIYLVFDEFELEQGNWDYLNIYSGADNTAPLLGAYSGTDTPGGGNLLIISESVTLEFISDGIIEMAGFGISYSCFRPQAVADFNQNIDETCSNEVIFTNASLYTTEDFSWDFGDGNSSNAVSPIHVYDTPGTYEVVLTAENESGMSTYTETVQITELPFDLSISAPNNVYLNSPTAFSYNSSSILSQIEWSTSSGNMASVDNPNFTFSQLGVEEITLTGTDINGCQLTTNETIFVDELSNINDNQLISTFKVYPNPTKGELNVDLDLEENAQIELTLFNAFGQKLLVQKIQSSSSMSEVFNLNDFPAGSYSLVVSLDGEFAGRRRLVLL